MRPRPVLTVVPIGNSETSELGSTEILSLRKSSAATISSVPAGVGLPVNLLTQVLAYAPLLAQMSIPSLKKRASTRPT